MENTKYVIMSSPVHGEFPIIFPSSIKHSMIVKSIKSEYPGISCTSAGFVDIVSNDISCYGSSTSLKIKSRPEDDIIIKVILRKN